MRRLVVIEYPMESRTQQNNLPLLDLYPAEYLENLTVLKLEGKIDTNRNDSFEFFFAPYPEKERYLFFRHGEAPDSSLPFHIAIDIKKRIDKHLTE